MILVTGATGFVGKAIVEKLMGSTYQIRACSRDNKFTFSSGLKPFVVGDLSEQSNWKEALQGIDVVIHLAARVHVMNDNELDPLTEYRKINTNATLRLAKQAASLGVKQFIFMSTIKVNGEATIENNCFKADDRVSLTDPYAISKYEAEQGLLALAKETNMEVVIIRPPLVFGPGVKANFESMIKWVKLGIPLPFGAVENKRSLIAIDNLVSFVVHCIKHPNAKNEVFLISDGEDISTTDLIQKIAKAFGRKAWLIPVPTQLMRNVAKIMGREKLADRLLGSLQIDNSKAMELLSWKPISSIDEQLNKLAAEHKK